MNVRVERGAVAKVAGVVGVLAALVAAPWVLDSYAIGLASRVLVLGLLAMSVNLLTGITGRPTLGQAAYFGVGAYGAALIARSLTPVGVVQVVAAAALGAAFAAVTAPLLVRTHGVTFLMLTFAIGELTHSAALELDGVTGGSDGRAAPPVVPVWGMSALRLDGLVYLWVLAVFLVMFVVVGLVVRSPFGLALRGVRDNEARLSAAGYPVRRYVFAAYVVAGAVAGVAGALWVSTERYVAPSSVGFAMSAFALIAVVLGGAGPMWGVVAGTAVVVFTRDYLGGKLTGDWSGHGALVLGLVFVLAVYLLPRWRARVS